jgi:serine/threonine protein kinase
MRGTLGRRAIPIGSPTRDMENKIFFGKYQVAVDRTGMPIELRRNASGVTCKAEEIESGREVALELVKVPSALDPETREKIEVEAAAAKQLNHVNIPALYDFGFDNSDLVYVTEYFEGVTAESWVTAHGPMPVRAVLRIALQVVSALGAATFQLVMHRSIHPGNIMIVPGQTPEGDWPLIKVLNFGRVLPLARKFGYGNVRDKSAPFASPEQLMKGTVDFRSEIYSLGCTLWSLLTGVSPFNAPGEPVAAAQMEPAMKRFSGVPRKVRRLITDMAATDPDDRPLDPVVMTEQLENCLASVVRREALARKLGIPPTWQTRRVKRAVQRPVFLRPIPVAAMLVALAALTAAFLTRGSESVWKRFSSQKPIGVPVGVPESSLASTEKTTPAFDQRTAANESNLVNRLNATKPATNSGNTSAPIANASPIPSVAPSVVAAANQNPPNEPRKDVSVAPANATQENEPPKVAATTQDSATAPPVLESQAPSPNESNNNAGDASVTDTGPASTAAAPAIASTPSATNTPAEPPTVAANPVPRAELIEPPPKSFATKKRAGSALKRDVVPRAQLIEPAPPAEGSDDSSATDTSHNEVANIPRAELIEPPPASSSKRKRQSFPPPSSLTDSERAAIRKVTRHPRSSRITAEGDGAMVRLPEGVVHARFIGTTSDGQWMLALPSKRIMVVPPPPDFVPR